MAALGNSRWQASEAAGDQQPAMGGDCGGVHSAGGGVGAGLMPELSRAAKLRRLGRIVRRLAGIHVDTAPGNTSPIASGLDAATTAVISKSPRT